MDEELKQLNNIAQLIQNFLEEDFGDDTNILVNRLGTINTYLAISGKALADAKLIQDKKASELFMQHTNLLSKTPATIVSKLIAANNHEANYTVNWLDRINRSLVHIGDNIRTQISFAKEELRITKTGY